jgi:hypothetical protein
MFRTGAKTVLGSLRDFLAAWFSITPINITLQSGMSRLPKAARDYMAEIGSKGEKPKARAKPALKLITSV